MRDFKDSALIVEALRESKTLLEVSEDGLKVRRKVPIGPIDDYHNRSIYAVSLVLRFVERRVLFGMIAYYFLARMQG